MIARGGGNIVEYLGIEGRGYPIPSHFDFGVLLFKARRRFFF